MFVCFLSVVEKFFVDVAIAFNLRLMYLFIKFFEERKNLMSSVDYFDMLFHTFQ